MTSVFPDEFIIVRKVISDHAEGKWPMKDIEHCVLETLSELQKLGWRRTPPPDEGGLLHE